MASLITDITSFTRGQLLCTVTILCKLSTQFLCLFHQTLQPSSEVKADCERDVILLSTTEFKNSACSASVTGDELHILMHSSEMLTIPELTYDEQYLFISMQTCL